MAAQKKADYGKGVRGSAYVQRGDAKLAARAERGVKNTDDIWEISGVGIGDFSSGRIPASDLNALCKAFSIMLKVIDVEHRAAKSQVLGRVIALGGRKVLESGKKSA